MYQNLLQIMTAVRLMARSEGVGVSELARELQISHRSVYRLLAKLDELHYPYYDANEGGKERCFKIEDPEARLRWWLPVPESRLSIEEQALLHFLLNQVKDLSGLGPVVQDLRQKIALWGAGTGVVLPSEPASGDVIRSFPRMPKKSNPEVEQNLTTLIRAITDHNELICTYRRPRQEATKTFTIHPLTLFEHNGGMYLIALVPKHGTEIRMAIERIVELRTTGETFTPPENPPDLSDPFGILVTEPVKVRLWFDAQQAFYLRERQWPESYVFFELENGELELEFKTIGLFEIKRWILGLGAGARVIEPEELRVQIAEELKIAQSYYS